MLAYFQKNSSAAPLSVFRIIFGLMVSLGMIRFWSKGWIDDLYVRPQVYFPYYGFEFVKTPGQYTYVLFGIGILAGLFVTLGLFYRLASILLFLCFTYIELIDKSNYLNHYYFISLIALMMIFLPAHVFFSVDAWRNKEMGAHRIPLWCTDALKLMVFIVYFFAGIAKINTDWLLEAMPLKIWLPAKNDLPLIGFLFNYKWTPFVFSWLGCLYDLGIVFFLLYPPTRIFAYFTVIVFHGLTALLFPIGMFPYVMILTATLFFSPEFHLNLIKKIVQLAKLPSEFIQTEKVFRFSKSGQIIIPTLFAVFFLFQLLFPFRYLLYPGELFWTEQGYRFSWRVMLMEKAGYAQFLVEDREGNRQLVNNSDFLSPLQEKMMSTQPDMMIHYAHVLHNYYKKRGFKDPRVYVDAYVALNGRLGKPLVDPRTDLSKVHDSFHHKSWILPHH